MNKKELPQSRFLGEAGNVGGLASLLKQAVGGEKFTRFVMLQGDHLRSGLLFLTRKIEQSSACEWVDLPAPMSAFEVANELINEARSARYSPNPAGAGDMYQMTKGWSISVVKIGGVKAALAWTTWVHN